MNSGIYKFDTEDAAKRIADEFAKKDDIYRVVIIKGDEWQVVKGGLT